MKLRDETAEERDARRFAERGTPQAFDKTKRGVEQWTRRDFLTLPHTAWGAHYECDSLVIFPRTGRTFHDSGFRMMRFVLVEKGIPFRLINGSSDVMHFDGIGGYGKGWMDENAGVPRLVPPKGWQIDCLPVSGLLQIWANGYRILTGSALSSFEFWAVPREKEKEAK